MLLPSPQKKETDVPESARFYQPELDALRFFSFCAVFVHHKSNPMLLLHALPKSDWSRYVVAGFHVAGAYGVEMFFLLSSYLITRLLRKEIALRGELDLRAFYIRRTLRIWPLYFFFLALCFALSKTGVAPPVPGAFFGSAALFVGNWYLNVNGYVWITLVLLWTISVEEQFYLTWPLLMRRATPRLIVGVSVSFILVSHVTLFWLRLRGVDEDAGISFNTLTQVQFFGMGALLALFAERRPAPLTLVFRGVLVMGGALCLGAAGLFDPRGLLLNAGRLSYNLQYLLISAGVLCVFRAFLGAPSKLFPNWILYLGKISYGLYVFNLFSSWIVRSVRGEVSRWAEFPLTFAVNLVLAMVSYRLLEEPFLRLKDRFEVVRSRRA